MKKIWAKLLDQYTIDQYNPDKGYIFNKNIKVHHSNPTEEQFLECGYKELILIAEEEHLPIKEGYYINTIYEDNQTQIIEKELYVKEPELEEEFLEENFFEEEENL